MLLMLLPATQLSAGEQPTASATPNGETVPTFTSAAIDPSLKPSLAYYYDLLIELQNTGIDASGTLVSLLQPMFTAALARSTQYDPVSENRALLMILGTWAGGQDLAALVPDHSTSPRRFLLKLRRRRDTARHFLASAGIVARSDKSMAELMGLMKEISDIDHGSGFSFTDLAADRAGSRFGELAMQSSEKAREIQQIVSTGVVDADLMPSIDDLPEHLRNDAFKTQFGHVGSAAYQHLIDEIDQRTAACTLYLQR